MDDVIENVNLKKGGCSIYHAQIGRKNRYESNFHNAEIEPKESIKIKPNTVAYAHLLWVYILTSNSAALIGLIAEIIQTNDHQKKIDEYIPVYMRNKIKEMGIDVEMITKKIKLK
ncbi:hypothetical protein [Paracoccus liaowanqingii]|uniref:hypothetical protein n=1 Tax=Paracoccus liaowanqingii TaxID=2560053 RepID=UPI0010920D70|nr:hypothetical protein [Paracoccus liaowanqingii]